VYACVHAAEEEDGARWFAAHVIVNLVLVFTHLFAVFLIFAEGVYVFIARRRRLGFVAMWAASHVVIFGLLGAWLYTANYDTVNDRLGWIQRPSFVGLVQVFLGYALGYLERTFFVVPRLRPYHLALGIIPLFLSARYLVVALRRTPAEGNRRLLLLALWLLVPPLSLFVLSYVWKPCLVPRYVMYASFPIYILAGAGLGSFQRRSLRVLSTVVLVGVCSYAASAVATCPFRGMGAMGAGERLSADVKPEDLVIVDEENFATSALSYYWPPLLSRATQVSGEEAVLQLLRPIGGSGVSAWVVSGDYPFKVETLSKALASLNAEVEDWEYGDTMLGGVRVFRVR
jgi:hypothetical protein